MQVPVTPVSHHQMAVLILLVETLELERAHGYDNQNDWHWLRVSHNEMHMMFRAYGKAPE